MFETANPSIYGRSNRFTVLEAVSFSLFVHAGVVAAAVANNLWQVTFPSQSPAMIVSFVLAAPEPPPPPPPAPAKPLARPEPQQAVVKPQEILAPTVIPDEIPIVQPTLAPALVSAAPSGVEGGVAWGVEGGTPGGLLGGEIGGKVGGVIGGVGEAAPADHMIHIARDKPLPMFPLSQVYPSYPEDARLNAWEDDLVVRYVIGKDGRIKEVEVVRQPQHTIFIDGTVRAIRSWRFRPLVRNGEKQEVVHELTIQYRLTQEG